MGNEQLLQEGSIGKLILKLCIPSVVIMLVMVLYNMVDIFFIGKLGDPMQVAAITLVGPLFSTIQALGTLLGTGGRIGISIALGKKEAQKIKSITSFCFYGAIGIGLLLSIAILLFSDTIIYALGANSETFTFAQSYINTLAIGIPSMILASVLANLVRADGSAHISMIGNGIGMITNIILDPILILVFSLGVQGAAIATIIGNVLSVSYLIYHILKRQNKISLQLKDIHIRKETTLDIILLGVPMASGTILMSFSNIFRNNVLIKYGNVVVAGSGVSGRIGLLIGMVIIGICVGIQPAISYNFGAGNLQRLKNIIKKTWITTTIIGIVFTSLIFVFRTSVVQLFIKEVEVIEYGQRFILGRLITGPVLGIYQLSNSFLQATGKVSFATFVALLRQGIVYVPIIYVMNRLFGLTGIIYSNAIADVLSILIALCFSLYWYRCLENKVMDEEEDVMVI